MSDEMNMIQAQQRYIDRVNGCHTGHRNRVSRAAWKELAKWAEQHGVADYEQRRAICKDAKDMAELERNADE